MSIFRIPIADAFEKTAGLPKAYFTNGKFDPAKAAAETNPLMRAKIDSYLAGKDIGRIHSDVHRSIRTKDKFSGFGSAAARARATFPHSGTDEARPDLVDAMKRSAEKSIPAPYLRRAGLHDAKTHAEAHKALDKVEAMMLGHAQSAYDSGKSRIKDVQAPHLVQPVHRVREMRAELAASNITPTLAERLAAIKADKKTAADSAARRTLADSLRSKRTMRNVGLAVGIPALAGLGYYAYKKLRRPSYKESLKEFQTSRSGDGDNK